MRSLPSLLGTLGGIIGCVGVLLAHDTGTLQTTIMVRNEAEAFRALLFAVGLSFVGVLGGFLAARTRFIGATLLLVAGTGGLLAASYFFLVPTLFFVTAAVLASKRPAAAPAVVPEEAASGRVSSLVCPRCRFRFGIPLTRPLAVQCPSCGIRGRLGGSVTPSSRSPTPQN